MRKRPAFRIALLGATLGLALLLSPASAQAQKDPAFIAAAAFDVVVLRPLGLVTALIGAGLFVPAALVSAPQGLHGIEEAWEQFVVTPFDHAYSRPLGEF